MTAMEREGGTLHGAYQVGFLIANGKYFGRVTGIKLIVDA